MPFDETAYRRVPRRSGVPTLRLAQNQQAEIEIVLRDDAGAPVNLLSWAPPEGPFAPQVRLTARVLRCSADPQFTLIGTILDAEQGRVGFGFTSRETEQPGLFFASVGVFVDDVLRHHELYYLEFEPTVFNSRGRAPLSVAEVRMEVNDACPDANYLLDDLEFTDAEIVHALRRAVDVYNESAPPVRGYGYDSFPYRAHWLRGTVAYLLRMVAHRYRRNALNYSAGGLTLADQEKAREYDAVADREEAAYLSWVRMTKVSANVRSGYGRLG